MRPRIITKALTAAAANNISTSASPGAGLVLINGTTSSGFTASGVCASQSPGAGAITINGTLATGGIASIGTIPSARKLFLTSGGNDSGITFTIFGRNGGNIVTEVVTGGNTTTVSSVNSYTQVTSITHTGSVAGTLVVGTQGIATLDTQRQIILTSGGNDTGITFTITGTDESGNTVSETITGASGGAATSVMSYLTLNNITHTGSVATTLTVGTNTTGATGPIIYDQNVSPFALGLSLEFTGSATATVQYTFDDPFAVNAFNTLTGVAWYDHATLVNINSTNTNSNIAFPVSAVRLKVTAGTGIAQLVSRQAGLWG